MKKKISLFDFNLNSRVNSLRLIFRDFDVSKINLEQKINEYVYLIDSKQGAYMHCNNSFQKSITTSLDKIERPPAYCMLDFDAKLNHKKYLVVPIDDFYFYQSEYIDDFINLCNKDFILKFLKKYGKEEILNETLQALKDSQYFMPSELLSKNYPLYRILVNMLIKTYHKNKIINENAEILLYCKKYILIDYESYFNNYYNRKLNYKSLFNSTFAHRKS